MCQNKKEGQEKERQMYFVASLDIDGLSGAVERKVSFDIDNLISCCV